MPLLNTREGYGALTKLFHWLVAGLFALQYLGATVMLRTPAGDTTLGLAQSTYYNWHKSLGLVALVIALARVLNRRAGELPPWAPSLSPLEQKLIHHTEPLLYAAMLIMPLSGFLYCMAGGYGVMLFGLVELPNPVGASPVLATISRYLHAAASYALLLPLGLHLGIVAGHHVIGRSGMITRMLPRRPMSPRS